MQFPQDQLLGQLVIVGLAARCLAESGADDWIKRASGILAGSIEFREGYGQVRGDKNANRIKLSQPLWWSYVIACLAIPERLKLAPRLPTSFEAMVNWMELDWPRALAKYAAVYGMPAAK